MKSLWTLKVILTRKSRWPVSLSVTKKGSVSFLWVHYWGHYCPSRSNWFWRNGSCAHPRTLDYPLQRQHRASIKGTHCSIWNAIKLNWNAKRRGWWPDLLIIRSLVWGQNQYKAYMCCYFYWQTPPYSLDKWKCVGCVLAVCGMLNHVLPSSTGTSRGCGCRGQARREGC